MCSQPGDAWNIEALAALIADELPGSAVLDFVQGQRRSFLLLRESDRIVKRFSTLAGLIGATPIPVADLLVLTPLQLLMIAIIGGLSCRPISLATAREYLIASGLTLGAAIGLREAARQLVKLVPAAGDVISGAVAAAGTLAIGRSAEKYFFDGEVVPAPSLMGLTTDTEG